MSSSSPAAPRASQASAGTVIVYERHELTVTRANLPVIDLPQPLDGVRIGLLTDTHRSRWVSHADVVSAVTALMNEQPDLIVLGGDYVTWGDRRYVSAAADALDALTAPHGVYGILGNHDDDHDMPAALTARGVQMSKNARTRSPFVDEALDLVGIRFWTRRAADIARLVKGASGTVVLLAHDPRRLTEAAGLEDSPGAFRSHAWGPGGGSRHRSRSRHRSFPSCPASGDAIARRSSSVKVWGPFTCRFA